MHLPGAGGHLGVLYQEWAVARLFILGRGRISVRAQGAAVCRMNARAGGRRAKGEVGLALPSERARVCGCSLVA